LPTSFIYFLDLTAREHPFNCQPVCVIGPATIMLHRGCDAPVSCQLHQCGRLNPSRHEISAERNPHVMEPIGSRTYWRLLDRCLTPNACYRRDRVPHTRAKTGTPRPRPRSGRCRHNRGCACRLPRMANADRRHHRAEVAEVAEVAAENPLRTQFSFAMLLAPHAPRRIQVAYAFTARMSSE